MRLSTPTNKTTPIELKMWKTMTAYTHLDGPTISIPILRFTHKDFNMCVYDNELACTMLWRTLGKTNWCEIQVLSIKNTGTIMFIARDATNSHNRN